MGLGLTSNIRLVAPEYNSQSRIQRSEHPAPTEGASLTTCENDRHDPASLPTDSCDTFPPRASLVIEIFCGVRRTLPRCQGQKGDPPHHASKQSPRQVTLGQEEPVVAGLLDQTSAGLYQPLLQAGERPVLDPLGQHQPSPQVPQIVRDRAQP